MWRRLRFGASRKLGALYPLIVVALVVSRESFFLVAVVCFAVPRPDQGIDAAVVYKQPWHDMDCPFNGCFQCKSRSSYSKPPELFRTASHLLLGRISPRLCSQ